MVSVDRLAVARAAAARPRGDGPAIPGLVAAAVMALVDSAFLTEAGWDSDAMLLCPPADHPLLGRPICRAADCSNTARCPGQICKGCSQRLTERGLGEQDPVEPDPLQRHKPDTCLVPGCARL